MTVTIKREPATVPIVPAVTERPRRTGPEPRSGATRSLVSEAALSRGSGKVVYFVVLVFTLVTFTAAFVFPFYWMFASAVKEPAEFASPNPTIIPKSFHPATYVDAWNLLNIAKFLWNTTYYAIGGWLLQLAVCVTVAYALSKLRPMFGRLVLFLILTSLMLPASALFIPAYLTIVDVPIFHVNLLNSPWALWLPAAANAFNVYVLKRFFDQIPSDLLDQASIDGAGPVRVLWSVVLPLSRPVLAVISIFSIIAMWKDFVWPLLVLQTPEKQTISVALARLSNSSYVLPTEMMAGLAIASIPMIIVFAIFQRQILSGLNAGSLKG